MRILTVIMEAWGWKGIRPSVFIMENPFGNVIFRDDEGQYWRICPEELSCEVIAINSNEFDNLRNTENFSNDWAMQNLVEQARSLLGGLVAERCYCLKLPGVLGGDYAVHNIGIIDRMELISFAGHLANQIKDLPDGAYIRLQVAD